MRSCASSPFILLSKPDRIASIFFVFLSSSLLLVFAIRAAIAEARTGDAVLIAGKGHEDYQIAGGERRHFSDRECVAMHSGVAQ